MWSLMNYKTRKNRLSDSTMNSDSINVYNDDKFETIPAIGIHRLIKTQVETRPLEERIFQLCTTI